MEAVLREDTLSVSQTLQLFIRQTLDFERAGGEQNGPNGPTNVQNVHSDFFLL